MTGERAYYVYILFRLNGIPCYVGKGKGARWLRHESRPRHENIHLRNIVGQARKSGVELPKIKVREGLSEEDAFVIERGLIAAIGREHLGGPLVNQTDGGDGTSGRVFTAEHRANIGAAKRGRKLSPEQRAHRKLVMNSPEVKARQSAAQKKSYQDNPERRAKASAASKGKGAPIEHLRRLAAMHYRRGATLSEETKQKIREARARQAPLSDDARRRIGESSKLRRHTEEAKEKIKAAWVIRKAQALTMKDQLQ